MSVCVSTQSILPIMKPINKVSQLRRDVHQHIANDDSIVKGITLNSSGNNMTQTVEEQCLTEHSDASSNIQAISYYQQGLNSSSILCPFEPSHPVSLNSLSCIEDNKVIALLLCARCQRMPCSYSKDTNVESNNQSQQSQLVMSLHPKQLNQATTLIYCINCKCHYCKQCYSEIHQSAKFVTHKTVETKQTVPLNSDLTGLPKVSSIHCLSIQNSNNNDNVLSELKNQQKQLTTLLDDLLSDWSKKLLLSPNDFWRVSQSNWKIIQTVKAEWGLVRTKLCDPNNNRQSQHLRRQSTGQISSSIKLGARRDSQPNHSIDKNRAHHSSFKQIDVRRPSLTKITPIPSRATQQTVSNMSESRSNSVSRDSILNRKKTNSFTNQIVPRGMPFPSKPQNVDQSKGMNSSMVVKTNHRPSIPHYPSTTSLITKENIDPNRQVSKQQVITSSLGPNPMKIEGGRQPTKGHRRSNQQISAANFMIQTQCINNKDKDRQICNQNLTKVCPQLVVAKKDYKQLLQNTILKKERQPNLTPRGSPTTIFTLPDSTREIHIVAPFEAELRSTLLDSNQPPAIPPRPIQTKVVNNHKPDLDARDRARMPDRTNRVLKR